MSIGLVRRHTRGEPAADCQPVIAVAARREIEPGEVRTDYVRLIPRQATRWEPLEGYGAILTELALEEVFPDQAKRPAVPTIHKAENIDHIQDGDVLKLDFRKGSVQSLFRIKSSHNTIFATDRCNSNCLMCSQPPKDTDDSELIKEHLRLVALIPRTCVQLGITGGEPTLLGKGLFGILRACRDNLPNTHIHMLTNGRLFYYKSFSRQLAEVGHPKLTLGIPLYSDLADHHDYVVQAQGAFDQTLVGLHNLARYGQQVEIRVVIHKQTYTVLPRLAQFIYRNCPFAAHVAIMGLEIMGYTKPNLGFLWIDPIEYQDQLEGAVTFLAWAGMHVSIYNHQLCVLRKSLWPFARKSISDFKNIYLDECQRCAVLERCGGLFKSGEQIHSKHIRPILS